MLNLSGQMFTCLKVKIPPLHCQPLSSAWSGSRSDCWHGQKQRVCFIVWLQLQWSNMGLLDKCPQTASTTWTAHLIVHFHVSRPLFLPLLHLPFFSLIERDNLHLTTFSSWALVFPYPHLNLLLLLLLASLSQPNVLLQVLVTRHTGLARS